MKLYHDEQYEHLLKCAECGGAYALVVIFSGHQFALCARCVQQAMVLMGSVLRNSTFIAPKSHNG